MGNIYRRHVNGVKDNYKRFVDIVDEKQYRLEAHGPP